MCIDMMRDKDSDNMSMDELLKEVGDHGRCML